VVGTKENHEIENKLDKNFGFSKFKAQFPVVNTGNCGPSPGR